MDIHLTKECICKTLASVVKQWKHPASDIYPCFCNETWYAECFLFYLSRLPFHNDAAIIPFINQQIDNALDIAFRKVCRVLDQHPADGKNIFELMCDEKFILRRDRRRYNQQVAGKYPKGLKKEEWQEYNHWVLTKLYWNGFLWSQESGFQFALPQDVDGPVELFLSNATKPLWGMRIKAQEVGSVYIGDDGDCINVYPYACFETYFGSRNKRHETKRAG
jgi:hypothetical protein